MPPLLITECALRTFGLRMISAPFKEQNLSVLESIHKKRNLPKDSSMGSVGKVPRKAIKSNPYVGVLSTH